jgi:hypothetical protein
VALGFKELTLLAAVNGLDPRWKEFRMHNQSEVLIAAVAATLHERTAESFWQKGSQLTQCTWTVIVNSPWLLLALSVNHRGHEYRKHEHEYA